MPRACNLRVLQILRVWSVEPPHPALSHSFCAKVVEAVGVITMGMEAECMAIAGMEDMVEVMVRPPILMPTARRGRTAVPCSVKPRTESTSRSQVLTLTKIGGQSRLGEEESIGNATQYSAYFDSLGRAATLRSPINFPQLHVYEHLQDVGCVRICLSCQVCSASKHPGGCLSLSQSPLREK